MTAIRTLRRAILTAGATALALLLVGCASSASPFAEPSPSGEASAKHIVIGSQSYYSNEIIAEIYAQALEAKGYIVDRKFNIGQRDAYLPALASGEVTLFPEYSGNLLQYYDKSTTVTSSADVYRDLTAAVPSNLEVLKQSTAVDQDSYTVTKAFATANHITSISDLARVSPTPILGGPAEQATSLYGPGWLEKTYGVKVKFTPIDDGGGPLTLKALKDNTIQVANIYTADPNIRTSDLVILADPKNVFSASNVVPLINKKQATPETVAIIDKISAALTTDDLVTMNGLSVNAQQASATIAHDWLIKRALLP